MAIMFIVTCIIVVIMIITVFGPALGAVYKKTYEFMGRQQNKYNRKKRNKEEE